MPSQELIDWIKNQAARGLTPEQVSAVLMQQGYTIDQATEAIDVVNGKVPVVKKRMGLIPVIIIGIIVIGLVIAGLYYYTSKDDSESMQEENTAYENAIVHVETNITDNLTDDNTTVGNITAVVDTNMEVTIACGDLECFEESFTDCTSANLTLKVLEGVVAYYEIIGPINDTCAVSTRYTENPNPDWVDKEMICKYNKSLDFMTAIQDSDGCEGALYTLIMGVPILNGTGHIDECYALANYHQTSCYIDLGKSEMDLTVCDQESDEQLKLFCYRGVGDAKKDVRICDLIPLEENNNRDWCYERVAFNTEDESLCESVEYASAQEYCYERIATKKQDVEICQLIVSDSPNRISVCEQRVAQGTY